MNDTLGTETIPVPVETRGLVDFPREKLTKKAITADHPTWCPGCGDFAAAI